MVDGCLIRLPPIPIRLVLIGSHTWRGFAGVSPGGLNIEREVAMFHSHGVDEVRALNRSLLRAGLVNTDDCYMGAAAVSSGLGGVLFVTLMFWMLAATAQKPVLRRRQ